MSGTLGGAESGVQGGEQNHAMEILSTCHDARDWTDKIRRDGKRIGFVPTMGSLHQGHLSLVDLAHQTCDEVVVSIFVNPTQFGPDEDLEKYPRELDSDLEKLAAHNVSMVFTPSAQEMYPGDCNTRIEPGKIASSLEGQHRPGHFAGVATIVAKLFHAIPADLAVFGQKDFQQFKVIESMVRDLRFGIELIAAPIIRESDGLAMSSRNAFLSKGDWRRALSISRSLKNTQAALDQGELDTARLESIMLETLTNHFGIDSLDYAVIVRADDLAPLETIDQPAVALVAAHVGNTRLIDNLLLKLP